MSKHERLKAARTQAGFKTAADAARHLRVPYGTYSGHESGTRGIKDKELKLYADAFDVALSWLAHDEKPTQPASYLDRASIASGYVGETIDGSITWFDKLNMRDSPPLKGESFNPKTGKKMGEYILPSTDLWIPYNPMFPSNCRSIVVSGTHVAAIARRGSVIYYDSEFREFEDIHLQTLSVLRSKEDYYLGLPNIITKDGMVEICGSSAPFFVDRNHLLLAPVLSVLTLFGRSAAMRAFADRLLAAAGPA